jgi:hypothetical protein
MPNIMMGSRLPSVRPSAPPMRLELVATEDWPTESRGGSLDVGTVAHSSSCSGYMVAVG